MIFVVKRPKRTLLRCRSTTAGAVYMSVCYKKRLSFVLKSRNFGVGLRARWVQAVHAVDSLGGLEMNGMLHLGEI
ncbi:hypothetical protein G7K_0766-t1 [Saitoella complicata NRRL Y-17804]|uniref:Uncharacterized protein n=1 Tax=Saitoella complicata (strain BCRC 22490 / CBS 7301 / JCM 7358 / NBRC 10748 / NRRL Y-17804) TaxID=698492 RepID=A0A0E9NA10_SAICN|nr:hypothetical protein G7K_0766-t1 [Saitoella complicata NRRL Y-17804]